LANLEFENLQNAFADFLLCCMLAYMQATISVSGRGLIALPAELRKAAGIRPQDSIIAETTPEGILLRPALTLPVEIYTPKRIAEFDAAESELEQVMAGQAGK
jgi:bifunctional DNA-binding transcriptional regulator/antitoxin component of YhaV-PrlF toxin-antitoxin module